MTNHASRITSTAAVIQRPGWRSGIALLDDGRRRGSSEITVVRELLLAVLTAPPVHRAVGAPALETAGGGGQLVVSLAGLGQWLQVEGHLIQGAFLQAPGDRKSTRLNSSHVSISYAVFCLKKKKTKQLIQVEAHKRNESQNPSRPSHIETHVASD